MFANMPGVLAFPINPPSLGQSFRNPPLQFVVQGNSYEELDRMVNALMAKARHVPGLANVDSDLKLNKPQFTVDIDREKAAVLGVQIEAIGRTLETLLGGRQVTRFKRDGKQYDVIVKLEDKDRRQPTDLTSIYVRGAGGGITQLSNLVTRAGKPLRRRSSTTSTGCARRSSPPTSPRAIRWMRRWRSWTGPRRRC